MAGITERITCICHNKKNLRTYIICKLLKSQAHRKNYGYTFPNVSHELKNELYHNWKTQI